MGLHHRSNPQEQRADVFCVSMHSGGLFIGDIDCAQNQQLLAQLQIGALLSVIDEPQFTVPKEVVHEVCSAN